MSSVRFIFVLLLFGVVLQAVAGNIKQTRLCASIEGSATSVALLDTGGIYMTAEGTVRVLIVFASFPDDTTPHAFWPLHQPPHFMQQFIDPDTSTRSAGSFNLTNYFRQMSLGKFNVIGQAIWIESTHSQEEYRQGAYGRANKNLLQEQADALIDFRQYDNWTKVSDYHHVQAPDSLVDMIIMVWRTNMFEYLGEASLGYWPGFNVDGIRIENGYPAYFPLPRGSGVTCQYIYTDTPYKVMQTMVHELSHWLLGKPHPYNNDELANKHVYWGMLCSNQRAASCANAYERERLGWISVPEIPSDQEVQFTDFISTGQAFKFHPPNGEPYEFYYIENHQKRSPFDDVTANPEDKGIWILHQEAPYSESDNIRMRPSGGMWRWGNTVSTSACFSRALPLFYHESPSIHGLSHRDQIPNTTSAINWLQALRDVTGEIVCGAFSTGERMQGSFNTANPIFSRYSNPGAITWLNDATSFSMEVISDIGGILAVRSHLNSLEPSPARRHLGVDPTRPPLPGTVSLAWGSQWPDGQQLESDVIYSELERRVGGGNWSNIYQGSAFSFMDNSLQYDTAGSVPVWFRVRVKDLQGKFSVWSDSCYATANGTSDVSSLDEVTAFSLEGNYPNPFNPSTVIRYTIPERSHVVLRVYDVLGQTIAELVNESRPAGRHSTVWNATTDRGSSVASGTYFVRIEARPEKSPPFVSARKMLIAR